LDRNDQRKASSAYCRNCSDFDIVSLRDNAPLALELGLMESCSPS
jgi:hypothetical protein